MENTQQTFPIFGPFTTRVEDQTLQYMAGLQAYLQRHRMVVQHRQAARRAEYAQISGTQVSLLLLDNVDSVIDAVLRGLETEICNARQRADISNRQRPLQPVPRRISPTTLAAGSPGQEALPSTVSEARKMRNSKLRETDTAAVRTWRRVKAVEQPITEKGANQSEEDKTE